MTTTGRRMDVALYDVAASVRGDVNHAVRKGERVSLCGCRNISLVGEPWDESSPWNCSKCVRVSESFEEITQIRAGRGGKRGRG